MIHTVKKVDTRVPRAPSTLPIWTRVVCSCTFKTRPASEARAMAAWVNHKKLKEAAEASA